MKKLPVDRNDCYYDFVLNDVGNVGSDEMFGKITEHFPKQVYSYSVFHSGVNRKIHSIHRLNIKDGVFETSSWIKFLGDNDRIDGKAVCALGRVGPSELPLIRDYAKSMSEIAGRSDTDGILELKAVPLMKTKDYVDFYMDDKESVKELEGKVLAVCAEQGRKEPFMLHRQDYVRAFSEGENSPEFAIEERSRWSVVRHEDMRDALFDRIAGNLFLQDRINYRFGSYPFLSSAVESKEIQGFAVDRINCFTADAMGVFPDVDCTRSESHDDVWVVRDREKKSGKAFVLFTEKGVSCLVERQYVKNMTSKDADGTELVNVKSIPDGCIERYLSDHARELEDCFAGRKDMTPKEFFDGFIDSFSLDSVVDRQVEAYMDNSLDSSVTMEDVLNENKVPNDSAVCSVDFGKIPPKDCLLLVEAMHSYCMLADAYEQEVYLGRDKDDIAIADDNYKKFDAVISGILHYDALSRLYDCVSDEEASEVYHERLGGTFYHYRQTLESPEEWGPKDDAKYGKAEEHCALLHFLDVGDDLLYPIVSKMDDRYGADVGKTFDVLRDDIECGNGEKFSNIREIYREIKEYGLDKAVERLAVPRGKSPLSKQKAQMLGKGLDNSK